MNIYIYTYIYIRIHIDHAWWLTRFSKWVKNPSYVCGISRLNPPTSLGLAPLRRLRFVGSFGTSPAALLQVMLRNLPNNYTRDMLLTLLDDKGFAGRPLENSKKAESQTGWNPWVGCHPQVEKSWRSHLPRDNVVIKYHFCWGIYRDSVVFLLCWREPWNSKTKHIIHIDIYIHRGFPKVSPLNQFWESLRDRLDGWDWMIFINVGMLILVFTEQPAGCLPFLMGKTPSPATPRIAA